MLYIFKDKLSKDMHTWMDIYGGRKEEVEGEKIKIK